MAVGGDRRRKKQVQSCQACSVGRRECEVRVSCCSLVLLSLLCSLVGPFCIRMLYLTNTYSFQLSPLHLLQYLNQRKTSVPAISTLTSKKSAEAIFTEMGQVCLCVCVRVCMYVHVSVFAHMTLE